MCAITIQAKTPLLAVLLIFSATISQVFIIKNSIYLKIYSFSTRTKCEAIEEQDVRQRRWYVKAKQSHKNCDARCLNEKRNMAAGALSFMLAENKNN